MNLNDFLAQVKARCAKATPGPWVCIPTDYVGFLGQQFFGVVTEAGEEDGERTSISSNRIVLEDAEFIACSRFDIEKLIRIVELQAEALRIMSKREYPLADKIIAEADNIARGEG